MPKDVFVRIKGDDDLSPMLKKIGAAAKSAGADLKGLDSSLKSSGKNAEETTRSMKEMRDQAKEVGLAVGILAGGLALSGAAFRDQEIGIRNLERSYGDAADDMREWADQLQDVTNFSNDAGVAAANTAATLARNYGFTADEIQQVLDLSADLAAANGTSLEYATQAVTAALRGEAEMAEQLGLTLNQAAIDHDNLTLSMSNEEAGHFRLAAALQQGAYAQGAAAEQADTFYGSLVDIGHGLQDFAQGLGESLGPLGEAGAYFSDNAIQITAMGLAIGQLGKGSVALNGLVKTMTGVNVAATLMTTALGPVGVAAAAVLATGAIIAMYQAADGMVPSFDKAQESVGELEDTIRDLYAAGSTLGALGERATEGIFPALIGDVERIREIENAIAQTNRVIGETGVTTDQQAADLERWSAELYSIASAYGILDASMLASTITQDDVIGAMEDLNTVLRYQGEGAAQAQLEVAELFDTFDRTHDAQTLIKDLDLIASQLGSYDEQATKAAAGTAKLTDEQKAYNLELAKANQTLDQYNANQQIGGQNLAGEHREEAAALDDLAKSRDAANQAMQEYLELDEQAAGAAGASFVPRLEESTKVIDDFAVHFTESTRSITEEIEKFQAVRQRMIDAMSLVGTPASGLEGMFGAIVGGTDKIAGSASAVADWAVKLGVATEHADEFGNSLGSWSRLDEILVGVDNGLQAATISQTEYTAAQEAFGTIAQENAEIQQNIAVIQAKQAPLIADQIEMTENYTQAIAEMDAAQATVALGFMDSAQAGKALELQTLAIDAAAGNLGAGGEEFATKIITGAAQADLQLQAMLVSMGLIAVDKEGNITVNFEDNATDPLRELIAVTEQLAYTNLLILAQGDTEQAQAAFEELFGHAAEWDNTTSEADLKAQNGEALSAADEAQNVVDAFDRSTGTADLSVDNSAAISGTGEASNAVGEFDRSTGTADIGVNDAASGPISNAIGLLNEFGGRNEVSTVTTVFNTIGSPPAFSAGSARQTGGILERASGGGIPMVPFIGGEAGFELVKRANGGGMAVLPSRGIYHGQAGDHVYNNETSKSMVAAGALGGLNVNISIGGDVIGEEGFAERMADMIAEGVYVALDRRDRGYAR